MTRPKMYHVFKCVFVVIAIMMSCFAVPLVYAAEVKTTGQWGDNITWTLDEEGTLSLSGSGKMLEGVTDITDDMLELPEEDRKQLYPWLSYAKDIKSIIIDNGITSVAKSAFSYDGYSGSFPYIQLETVQLPSTLTEIGDRAFAECKHLQTINVPANVKVIGTAAFYNCLNLKTLALSENISTIAEDTFWGCEKLEKIVLSDGLSKVDKGAFFGCKQLPSIELPDTLESIGAKAFGGCSGLTKIIIPSKVSVLGDSVFCDCSGLKEVIINSNINETVRFGTKMFSGCISLSKVELPDNCSQLDYTFENCVSLKSIKIPKDVENMKYTFQNCTSLVSAKLPDGVKELNGTFSGCSSLKTLTIPASVKVLDGELFSGCKNLKKLDIKTTKLNLKKNNNRDIMFKGFCKDGVIILPTKKYADYKKWLAYFVGKKVVFQQANGEVPKDTSAGKIVDQGKWGSNIQWKLEKNGTLTLWGKGAMQSGRAHYTELGYDADTPRYPWCQYAKSVKMIVIKSGITNVSSYAFSSYTPTYGTEGVYAVVTPFSNLSKVKLGSTVKTIDMGAFMKCKSMKMVSFPENLCKIDAYAFNGCTGLQKLVFPKALKEIGLKAFRKCSKLYKITFPDKLSKIGSMAFSGCNALREVRFPKGLKRLNTSAFENCINLKKIVIPKNTNQSLILASSCFRGCKKLKSITIQAENWDTKKAGYHLFEGIDKNAVFVLTKSNYSTYKKKILESAPDTVKFKKSK